MQKPAGRVTALGYFISKLGERALPFFKLMKKKRPFEWTPEADQAFRDLKKYLTSPPVMVAPQLLEPLLLYLAATPYSASVALVVVREERQDKGRADAARGQRGPTKPSAAEDLAQRATSRKLLRAVRSQETHHLKKCHNLRGTRASTVYRPSLSTRCTLSAL